MPPKKSKSDQFKPKDLVLSKMPGYSSWPSFVMPQDMIPDAILSSQKNNSALCVIFIPDGDYYWINEKSIKQLDFKTLEGQCNKFEAIAAAKQNDKKKTKERSKGATTIADAFLAARGLTFDSFMTQLDAKLNATKSKNVSKSQEGMPSRTKGSKSKSTRQSQSEEDEIEEDIEDEDEGEGDGEEEAEAEHEGDNDEQASQTGDEDEEEEDIKEEDSEEEIKPNRRRSTRKRGSGSESETTRTPRNGRNNSKRGNGVEKKSDDELVTRKHRRNSGTENDDNSTSMRGKRFKTESPGPVSNPISKSSSQSSNSHKKELTEEERLQQLWFCRIKLQKSLIQRETDDIPNADELSTSRLILKKLVDFKIDLELLKTTKIHKVLKCIIKNKDLEYPESFKLHDQCQELLQKWAGLIEEIKMEKTAIYLSKQRERNGDNDSNDKKVDESEISDIKEKSVKSPNELKFASVES